MYLSRPYGVKRTDLFPHAGIHESHTVEELVELERRHEYGLVAQAGRVFVNLGTLNGLAGGELVEWLTATHTDKRVKVTCSSAGMLAVTYTQRQT